ncbi:MAG: ferrous iron transport protein A [Clostridia bacterium]|nr:ferrous iron transport protein A [Clostridia bacterium]
MKLSGVKKGEQVKIIEISGGALKARLNSMGIKVGDSVSVINIAPYKTPIEIKKGNFRLAIGKPETDNIAVEYYV